MSYGLFVPEAGLWARRFASASCKYWPRVLVNVFLDAHADSAMTTLTLRRMKDDFIVSGGRGVEAL
jgi:hypothetical protein